MFLLQAVISSYSSANNLTIYLNIDQNVYFFQKRRPDYSYNLFQNVYGCYLHL